MTSCESDCISVPSAEIFSRFGILIGPPKVLEAPKPMSSISTTTTFGAPCGAFHFPARGRLCVAGIQFLVGLSGGFLDRQYGAI